MEVNPMWFVVVGVIVAVVLAYRHGKLAGFVAKVKADEAKFASRFLSTAAANGAAADKPSASVLKLAESELVKFGDEVKGWTKHNPAVVTDLKPGSVSVVGVPIAATADVAVVEVPKTEPPAPQPTTEQRLDAVQAELNSIRALPKA